MSFTVQYYDIVLGGVLASLLAGVAVGWLTSVPLTLSVPAFGIVAALLIGHGMFVRGPIDRPADLTDEVEAFE